MIPKLLIRFRLPGRHRNKVKLNFCKNSTSKRSFHEQGIKLYNALPQYVKDYDVDTFKWTVKRLLCEHSLYEMDEYFYIFMVFESCKCSIFYTL
ncbi:hypothetical protein C0J52_03500 [Blattella germanica]|nr:hypothetical protein C0J52_03500 [Blattella germanica]